MWFLTIFKGYYTFETDSDIHDIIVLSHCCSEVTTRHAQKQLSLIQFNLMNGGWALFLLLSTSPTTMTTTVSFWDLLISLLLNASWHSHPDNRVNLPSMIDAVVSANGAQKNLLIRLWTLQIKIIGFERDSVNDINRTCVLSKTKLNYFNHNTLVWESLGKMHHFWNS